MQQSTVLDRYLITLKRAESMGRGRGRYPKTMNLHGYIYYYELVDLHLICMRTHFSLDQVHSCAAGETGESNSREAALSASRREMKDPIDVPMMA